MGWCGKHVVQDLIDATIGRKKGAMPLAYEKRMFTYHPESMRVLVYFIGYQIKNLYDTIIWNDGALFIAHHILALFSAVSHIEQCGAVFGIRKPYDSHSAFFIGPKQYGGCFGNAHFYALFYFGFSEVSTGGE